MSCMCLKRLQDFLKSLKNLPLNALAGLIPKDLPQLTSLGGMSSGIATVHAMVSARAQLQAALRLGLPPFPLPALDLGRLEAMAFLAGTTGVNPLSANASLHLNRLVNSMNVNLPSLMQLLMELLEPLLDPLMDLLAMLQAIEAVRMTFNVNLLAPGAMAALQAALSATATASVSASANLAAMLDLGMYGRLMRASAALGFDLSMAGALPRLHAALQLAAGLPIPALNVSLPQMNALANLLAALTPIQQSMLGVNLALPNALDLLKALIGQLLANLAVPLPTSLTASLSETATLGSQLAAVPPALGMNFSAMASMRISGLPLNLLPDLGSLTVAARLGQATGLNVFASSPCGSSCPVAASF